MSKYHRWYEQLIAHARQRPPPDVYFEIHHIVPRALGGGDEPSNLIELTYREHFLAHWLLTKMLDGRAKSSMVRALYCMTHPVGRRIVSGWQFEVAKRALRNVWLQRQALRAEAKLKEKEKIKAKAWEAIRIASTIKIARNHRNEISQLATDYLRAAPRKRKKLKAAFLAEFNR